MEPNEKSPPEVPKSFFIGQDLDWMAPWVDVSLRVELPYWLMVNTAQTSVVVDGHSFAVGIENETFELHLGCVSDEKKYVAYQGPLRQVEQLPDTIQDILRQRPELGYLWRKCKTVVKIASRCNEDVWRKVEQDVAAHGPSVHLYLQELCRAHISIVNKLVRGYRLSTYDHFVFEVAPWDVPIWHIQREGTMASSLLVPYKGWDDRIMFGGPSEIPGEIQFIDAPQLQHAVGYLPSKGELELLDAINFMERGNYSDAVRRITTAIEVIVEAEVYRLIKESNSKKAAETFIKSTRADFSRRVKKYEQLTRRTLPVGHANELRATRKLRHRIVHGGHRVDPGERGTAQRAVDTGRWIFNWFENDESRKQVREKKLALRSLGREMSIGLFRSEISADGVRVFPEPLGAQ
ncbi:hypothetical protein WJ542_07310 [Paraburkholderia sp. B3]|uniref:hypothetical protein n=1 Tax=Paraburkholderia sp. B3 TaxID=3134791 RepID=UPI0039829159